jgi:Transposase IS66 family
MQMRQVVALPGYYTGSTENLFGHVRCTQSLSYLFVHAKRGKEAVDDLVDYQGILVSDFWSSYVKLSCGHVFCGAHLLRELDYLGTVCQLEWASKMKYLFEEAVSACHRARERGNPLLWSRFDIVDCFDRLLALGLRTTPKEKSKACALLKRLLVRSVFVFFAVMCCLAVSKACLYKILGKGIYQIVQDDVL